MDFAVPVDHWIKLKECEKKNKYLDLARELNKLWNMKVTIIPIAIGAFGTVTRGLLKELEDLEVRGRVEIIQTTALLRTVRILRIVLETCCHSNCCEKPSADAYVKNSHNDIFQKFYFIYYSFICRSFCFYPWRILFRASSNRTWTL